MKRKKPKELFLLNWWRQLINSFRSIWSKRFLKVFFFDLLVLVAFILIFSSVTIKIKDASPTLDQIGPLAQQLIDTIQKSQTEIVGANLEIVRHNASMIKSVAYGFFFSVAKQAIIGLLLLALFIYPFRFIGWGALVPHKSDIRLLGKFYALRIAWASIWLAIILMTAWFIKFPVNAIVVSIEIILFLYFGVFLNLIFFNGGIRIKQLVRCFLLGIKIKTLIWLGTLILVVAIGTAISTLLLKINLIFTLLILVFISLISPWSKIYLTAIYHYDKQTRQ